MHCISACAFVNDFATTFRTELLNPATNPADFGNKISTLLFDRLNAEIPVCPGFHSIATMYREELLKLSDSYVLHSILTPICYCESVDS